MSVILFVGSSMLHDMAWRRLWWALTLVICGCGDSASSSDTKAYFELAGETGTLDSFYNHPFPSVLRTIDGRPDLRGYPTPSNIVLLADLLPGAAGRQGFSTSLASFFRFDGELAVRVETDLIPADVASGILLIDIDPNSPLGKLKASNLPYRNVLKVGLFEYSGRVAGRLASARTTPPNSPDAGIGDSHQRNYPAFCGFRLPAPIHLIPHLTTLLGLTP